MKVYLTLEYVADVWVMNTLALEYYLWSTKDCNQDIFDQLLYVLKGTIIHVEGVFYSFHVNSCFYAWEILLCMLLFIFLSAQRWFKINIFFSYRWLTMQGPHATHPCSSISFFTYRIVTEFQLYYNSQKFNWN